MPLKRLLLLACTVTLVQNSPLHAQWIRTTLSGRIISLFTSSPYIYAGVEHYGVYASTDNGGSWVTHNKSFYTLPTFYAFSEQNANLFAALGPAGLDVSTDYGTNWLPANGGGALIGAQSLIVSGLYLYAGREFGAGRAVYRSLDYGSNWAPVDSGIRGDNIRGFANYGTKLFAATEYGPFVTVDGGLLWNASHDGVNYGVYTIAVLDTVLFAGTYGNGVYRSLDGGEIWTEANNGMRGTAVRAFAVYGANIFAGTDYGVLLSTDYGTSWTDVSTRLGGNVYSLAAYPPLLFAGCGDFVYKRPLGEMVTSAGGESVTHPSRFFLDQNYPNPFNPETNISYQIARSSMVRLSVYDILGRVAAVLVSEKQGPGFYEVRFDGSSLTSGVYIYRLSTEAFSQSRKMLLVK